jgi:hypothetical protein
VWPAQRVRLPVFRPDRQPTPTEISQARRHAHRAAMRDPADASRMIPDRWTRSTR